MNFCIFLVLLVTRAGFCTTVVHGHDIVVPLRYTEVSRWISHVVPPHQIDVNYACGDRLLRGTARMRFVHNLYNYEYRRFDREPRLGPTIACDSVIISDHRNPDAFVQIPYPIRVPDRDHSESTLIAFGFDTLFTNIVGSVIIAPINRTNAMMILNPLEPGVHVQDGRFMYTRSHADADLLEIETSVIPVSPDVEALILNTTNSITYIDTQGDITMIHSQSYDFLIAEIQRYAESVIGDDNGHVVRLRDPRHIDSLPTIEFLVTSVDNDQEPFALAMFPRDYVTETSPNEYRLDLRPNDDHIVLGYKFMQTVVLHVDNVNHRIGFGEPLADFE